MNKSDVDVVLKRAVAERIVALEKEKADLIDGNAQLQQMLRGWNEQATQIVLFLGGDPAGFRFADYVVRAVEADVEAKVEKRLQELREEPRPGPPRTIDKAVKGPPEDKALKGPQETK